MTIKIEYSGPIAGRSEIKEFDSEAPAAVFAAYLEAMGWRYTVSVRAERFQAIETHARIRAAVNAGRPPPKAPTLDECRAVMPDFDPYLEGQEPYMGQEDE